MSAASIASAAILACLLTLLRAPVASAIVFPQGEVDPASPVSSVTVAVLLNEVPGRWAPQQFCAGTLLAAQMVVTAGHCVEGLDPSQLLVASASGPLSAAGVTAVTGFTRHPGYADSGSFGVNDIAVLRLAQPMPGPYAALPRSKAAEKRALRGGMVAAGYGMDENGQSSDVLRYALVSDYSSYGARFYESFHKRSHVAAARVLDSGALSGATCSGDSGGPLLGQGRWSLTLIGVTSFGREDCVDPAPGIFMRTRAYASWLSGAMADLVASVGDAQLLYESAERLGDASPSADLGPLAAASRPGQVIVGAEVPTSVAVSWALDTDFDQVGDVTFDGVSLVDPARGLSCPARSWYQSGMALLSFDPACLSLPVRMVDVLAATSSDTARVSGVALL